MENSKKVEVTAAAAYVSEDILFAEILPRLSSVKSLLKLSCVSKSWLSFISSKEFAKTHLRKSVNTNLISLSDGFNKAIFINYCCVGSMFTIPAIRYQFPYIINNFTTSHIVGCSNGLCCILIDGIYFILFNAVTRKSYVLPYVFNKDVCGCSNKGFGNDRVCEVLSVKMDGFGYDETNNDYIVFALIEIKHASLLIRDYVLRLYNLKANSWKTVDHSKMRHIAAYTTGVLLNGRLHWAKIWTDDELHGYKPFSFQLGTGAFDLVEGPSAVKVERLYPAIGVVQGCLCMLCDEPKDGTEVWVMKEYGVKESWYKMVTIPRHGINSHPPLYNFKVIYVSEDGNFLLHLNSCLYIYNPVTNFVREAIKAPDGYMATYIGLCVESLVSPLPHGEGVELN